MFSLRTVSCVLLAALIFNPFCCCLFGTHCFSGDLAGYTTEAPAPTTEHACCSTITEESSAESAPAKACPHETQKEQRKTAQTTGLDLQKPALQQDYSHFTLTALSAGSPRLPLESARKGLRASNDNAQFATPPRLYEALCTLRL